MSVIYTSPYHSPDDPGGPGTRDTGVRRCLSGIGGRYPGFLEPRPRGDEPAGSGREPVGASGFDGGRPARWCLRPTGRAAAAGGQGCAPLSPTPTRWLAHATALTHGGGQGTTLPSRTTRRIGTSWGSLEFGSPRRGRLQGREDSAGCFFGTYGNGIGCRQAALPSAVPLRDPLFLREHGKLAW